MIYHKDWDINEHATGQFKNGKPVIGATFQNGLNDIEPDGSFVPCDEGISEVTQGVTHLKMNRGRMGELRFGDSSHPNSFLVKIKNKAFKGVSFKYTGANGSSMTANNGKPLCHFDNDISIESTPYYKGVKMDIIVNDPLTAPLEYPFSIKTYGQGYTFIEENGGATLRGEDQDPIFIKPPYAIDANGDIGIVTIQYTGMVNNLITFKKVVDEEWFRQAAAPVRIDPDVTIDDDTGTFEDAIISTGFPNNNLGANPQGDTLSFDPAPKESTLLYVDLSVYTNISVTDARFGLDVSSGTYPIDTNMHNVLVAWGEGNKVNAAATDGECSWNHSEHPTTWNTAGCKGNGSDRAATPVGSLQFTANNSDTHYAISNASVQGWIDDAVSNFGVLIESPNAVSGKLVVWRSSEGPGNKPYFYMEYTVAGIVILRRRREGY